MDRILGVDYGTRRIGIATGDSRMRIAMPLATLEGAGNVDRDARQVAEFAAGHQATAIVVGLPLSMDGTDSEQTRLTRRFAAVLAAAYDGPVHLHDERLTSHAADAVLREAGASPRRSKELSDRIAAQKILQGYLDSLKK